MHRHNDYDNEHRPPQQWEPVQQFTSRDGSLLVQVTRDMSATYPKFSFAVGRPGRDEGSINRYIPVLTTKVKGRRVARQVADDIAALIEDMCEWVNRELEQDEVRSTG